MPSRFSNSFLLLPIFLFVLAISPNLNEGQLLWSLIIIHFLVYPAAYGFHTISKDGTKASLFSASHIYSFILFAIALTLAFLKINLTFTETIFIYALASFGYGNYLLQLKKHTLTGGLCVGFLQGFFTVLMCYVGINKYEWNNLWNSRVLIPALLVCLLVFGAYLAAQIFVTDNKKFEYKTFGTLFVVRSTFKVAMVVFIISIIALAAYFYRAHSSTAALYFLISMALPLLYFLKSMIQPLNNQAHTNNTRIRWFMLLLAICLNGFMVWFFLETSHILQL